MTFKTWPSLWESEGRLLQMAILSASLNERYRALVQTREGCLTHIMDTRERGAVNCTKVTSHLGTPSREWPKNLSNLCNTHSRCGSLPHQS